MDLPPTTADKIDRLTAEIERLRYRADRIMETAEKGARGQLLTVAEAQTRGEALCAAIEAEEAAGSQRHRRVHTSTRLLTLIVVVIIDFPIMLWLASSIFNVDWSAL
jgi:hypothetical protein